jgi:hypothetical protein
VVITVIKGTIVTPDKVKGGVMDSSKAVLDTWTNKLGQSESSLSLPEVMVGGGERAAPGGNHVPPGGDY